MNTANEEAVFAFLNGEIRLYDIYQIVENMLDRHNVVYSLDIDEIFEIDKEIRLKTQEYIHNELVEKV